MTEEHKHEYKVCSFPVTTTVECHKAAKEIERLFNEGWLPTGGFQSFAAMPKNHHLFTVMARDKK